MASKRKLASPGMAGFLYPNFSLTLDTNLMDYGAEPGTTVGTFTTTPADAVVTLMDSDGGKFALDGKMLTAGAVATSAEADGAYQNVTVRVQWGFQFWDVVVRIDLQSGGGGSLAPDTDVSAYSFQANFFYAGNSGDMPDLSQTDLVSDLDASWGAYNIAISDPGTGYTSGDLLALPNPGGTNLVFVRSVDGNGAITSFEYYESVGGTAAGTPITDAVYYPTPGSGGGTGAKFSALWSNSNLLAAINAYNTFMADGHGPNYGSGTYAVQIAPVDAGAGGAESRIADVSNAAAKHGDGRWEFNLLDGNGDAVPGFFTVTSTPGADTDDFTADVNWTLVGIYAP